MGIIHLPNEIMKSIVSKIVRKTIKKKLGCDVDLQLNELTILPDKGVMNLHLDLDASISNDDLKNVIKTFNA